MSLLSSESPDFTELLGILGVHVLWHPSLSSINNCDDGAIIEQIVENELELDFLCIEGAIVRGPSGTGMYDCVFGKPKKDFLAALAQKAKYVLAIGTCASFGGIGANGDIEACGAQFLNWDVGGFLGADFLSRGGFPVINLPGCPCHCEVVTKTLTALIRERPLQLDQFNSPIDSYGLLVHQGVPVTNTMNTVSRNRISARRDVCSFIWAVTDHWPSDHATKRCGTGEVQKHESECRASVARDPISLRTTPSTEPET